MSHDSTEDDDIGNRMVSAATKSVPVSAHAPIPGAWGDSKTQHFFSLTPERVLGAVEEGGLQCTGRCMALNSFENRVYDVEIELDEKPKHLSEKFRIVKFYRPGRWTREQILEEHSFLQELQQAEIPVIAPLRFSDGETLRETSDGISYTVFPKVGGRAPEELDAEQLVRVGRLLGRIHTVGAQRAAPSRITLTPSSYGLANLEYLQENGWIPAEFAGRYAELVHRICEHAEKRFEDFKSQRVHGDCHLGNLLWSPQGPFFLDFDDLVTAPPVQDLWLLLPSRDRAALELLLEGYREIREFDAHSISLIETLRALRFIHYTGWIARRWTDPAFPKAFPQFGSPRYWKEETDDLELQWRLIRGEKAFD